MIRRIVCAILLCSFVASCGGVQAITERPLTSEEASLLAEVQYQNYEIGGADFSVNAAYLGFGETLSMTGMVDWKNHRGRATVSAKGKDAGIVEVIWNSTLVFERRPNISRVLESKGSPGVEYVMRKPDPENRLIDRAIAVIVSLATKERENALLVQQKDGTVFMRNDSLRDKEVLVLRYGRTLRYWVNPDDARMMRFEGDSTSGAAPIVVDILAFGARKVELPMPQIVVAADSINELYEASLVP